jgi:hypothetical protein
MEGIASEAASIADHLRLAKLCWICDNDRITIEGGTDLAFSDDVATRFIGYGWNVTRVGDANDRDMLARALRSFHDEHERPTLIIVDSHIAYGAPTKQGAATADRVLHDPNGFNRHNPFASFCSASSSSAIISPPRHADRRERRACASRGSSAGNARRLFAHG